MTDKMPSPDVMEGRIEDARNAAPSPGGVVLRSKGIRTLQGNPGLYQVGIIQTPTVQTPYRPMLSPSNYVRASLYEPGRSADAVQGRVDDLYRGAMLDAANAASRNVSQADRAEREALVATRQAKQQMLDEMGNPLSLADMVQRDADRAVSRLTPDEVSAYSAAGIDAQNAADEQAYQAARAAAAPMRGTGRPWVGQHLQALSAQKAAKDNDIPVTPDLLDPATVTESRLSWLSRTNADLFQAVSLQMSQGRMTPADVAAVTNLSLAHRAAQEIAATPDPIRRAQILGAQGTPAQQALVLAVLSAPQPDDVASDNLLIQAVSPIGDFLMEHALPFLATTSQYVIRGAMTTANILDNEVVGRDTTQNGSLEQWNWEVWRDAWNQTAPGYFRPQDKDYLRNKYGASKADLMLEAYQLRNSGEGDVVGSLYEKYQGNVEALNIIDAIFFSRDPSPEMQDLVQETAYMDWGNYANWQVRGLADMSPGGDLYTEVWKAPGYSWARDALNVTAWMALDPYLLGGKAVRVAKYARMGLHNLAPGKIDNVFQKASVQRYWDDLGGRLKEIRNIENGRERRAALRQVSRQESHWFPKDVVQSLYDAEVHSAEDALHWFKHYENLQRVLAGQPARRITQAYVPHAKLGRVTTKRMSRAFKALDPTMRVAARHGEEFDDVIARADEAAGNMLEGRKLDELSDEEAAAVLVRISNVPESAEIIGKWMTSLTGERTAAGKFLDLIKVGNFKKARQYGWQHEKNADNFMQFVSRTFATVPDMRAGIRIDDARDARKVYQQARIAGFPRWFAVELEQMFAAANQGQRRLMLAGLARTQAYVIGADLIDPDSGVENMVKLVTGYRPGEAYAATMLPGATRKLQEIVANIRKREEASALRLGDEGEDVELGLLNEAHGEQAVNDAMGFEDALILRGQLEQRVRELEQQQKDIAATLNPEDAARAKQLDAEVEVAYQELLANYTGNRYNFGQVDGAELLGLFYLPTSKSYKVPAITFRKTAGGGRQGVIKDADGNPVTYTIERDPEFGHFTVKRDDEIVGSAMNMTQARNLAKRDITEKYSIVDEVRTSAGTRELRMLERGYLPRRWAEAMARGDVPENIDPEMQARLFLDPTASEDDLINIDWQALAESAGRPAKGDGVGGKDLWIEIPWVQDLRQQARLNVEGQLDEAAVQAEGALEQAVRELAEQDEYLAALRGMGVRDLRTLRESIPRKGSMTEDEILEEARGAFETWARSQPNFSPSESTGGQQAVFMGQTTDVVAFPSITQFEPLMARNTYFGTLLGRNVGSAALTDLWVFATLAGPRFAVRNAFEDWIFWGLSAGTMVGEGSLRAGRRASQGLRQSRQVESKKLVAARKNLDDLQARRNEKAATMAPNELRDIDHEIEAAQKEFERQLSANGKVRTEKLGLIKTAMRRIGTKIGKLDSSVDSADSRLKAIVHPYLSDEEIVAANKAYAEHDRTGLARLIAVAATRERILFLPPGDSTVARLQAWVRARNGDISVLSAKDQAVLSDLEQFAMGRNGFDSLNDVSEEARNMLDGYLPSWQDTPDFVYAGDTPLQRVFLNTRYQTEMSGAKPTRKAVNATWQTLAMALHGDGPKSQAAMRYLPEWMQATATQREKILDEIAAEIIYADSEVGYLGRFSLVNPVGEVDEAAVRELARRTVQTLEGAFTQADGSFNKTLWNALKRDDMGEGNLTNFKLWDDVEDGQGVLIGPGAGKREYRVSKYELIDGKYELPRTYLTFEGDGLLIPADAATGGVAAAFGSGWKKITNPGWDMMGRSLARMTREPMYLANYLEARAFLRPFEAEWKRLYGDDWWRVADEVANERAYNTTLSYVDNPAVRSQLAWQVRNVARFWRAQEDFFRRSYRLVKNNPMGVYKAAWAFNVLQSVGFFQTDENGEQYFIYPASRAGTNMMNTFISWAGLNFKSSADLPLMMSGKLTMLTPSADPEATMPTLSGPLYPMALKTLLRAAPTLDPLFRNAGINWRPSDAAYALEATALGEISAGSQAGPMDALPTHLKRMMYLVFNATKGDDARMAEVQGAAADAARLAITAHVRAGNIKAGEELTNDNRDDIMARIEDTTWDILVLKFLGGMFLPASPQIMADDLNSFAREYGMYSLKQEYYDLRTRLGDDEALALWIERHPDEAPYTVSSAGGPSFDGFWSANVQTEEWIRDNRTLVDEYPLAASLFAPDKREEMFNPLTYRFLQRQGLLHKGTVGDFLQKSMNVNSWLDYLSAKAAYDRGVDHVYANATSAEARTAALKELDDRLANYRSIAYDKDPALEERVKSNDWGMSSQAVISEIGQALPVAIANAEGDQLTRLEDMREVYNMYLEGKSRLDAGSKLTPEYEAMKDEIRDRWKGYVLAWYEQYRDDDNFVRVLKTASDALGFQIRELR